MKIPYIIGGCMSDIPQVLGDVMAGKIINRLAEIKREKEEREGASISWDKVAKDTGLAYTTILRWANDHINRFDDETLAKLCEYFEVQPGDILKYED
jgi:DNA-binding Xre family transcriptional regulator